MESPDAIDMLAMMAKPKQNPSESASSSATASRNETSLLFAEKISEIKAKHAWELDMLREMARPIGGITQGEDKGLQLERRIKKTTEHCSKTRERVMFGLLSNIADEELKNSELWRKTFLGCMKNLPDCGKCDRFVDKAGVVCVDCNKSYHLRCVKNPEIAQLIKTWRCDDCVVKKPASCYCLDEDSIRTDPFIHCDQCNTWFHIRCLLMSIKDANRLADSTWSCPACREHRLFIKVTSILLRPMDDSTMDKCSQTLSRLRAPAMWYQRKLMNDLFAGKAPPSELWDIPEDILTLLRMIEWKQFRTISDLLFNLGIMFDAFIGNIEACSGIDNASELIQESKDLDAEVIRKFRGLVYELMRDGEKESNGNKRSLLASANGDLEGTAGENRDKLRNAKRFKRCNTN